MAAAKLRDPDSDGQETVPDAGEADQITTADYIAYLEKQGVDRMLDPDIHVSIPILRSHFPKMSEKQLRNLVERQVKSGRLVFVGNLYDPEKGVRVDAYRAVAS